MAKVLLALLAALSVVIAAANYAYKVTTDPGEEPVNEAWARGKMEFATWNHEKWSAWIHAGEFTLVPQNTHDWSRHSNASLAFTDWEGEFWQAKIDGDVFLFAYQGNWQGPIDRSEAIRFRDWSGNNQVRTITELRR